MGLIPLERSNLLVKKVAGAFNIYPPSVTAGNDVYFFANQTDTKPVFYMIGGGRIILDTGAAEVISLMNNGVERFWIYGSTDNAIIQAQNTNDNISLIPNGTGKVKFGTYTAGAATDSTGYISILDAAGNARKLMVQA